MSARMPVTVTDSKRDAGDVHEWLEQVSEGHDSAQLATSQLATVCAAAVDPLEIAVALEVAGISHAVATERYNRADVFALARTLWNRIPLRPADAKVATLPRSGDRRDLARGVLYVVPAVMLLALTTAFDLHLARWALPLAITWGWGIGQVAAFVGYRVQGSDLSREAVITRRVISCAVLSTALLSTGAAFIADGGVTEVTATTALATYMVSSAILLVRSEEQWLALLLLPGFLASMVVLTALKESSVSQVLAVVVIGGSTLAVVGRALRRPKVRIAIGSGGLDRRDIGVAAGHLLHGVICGLAVSLVVIHLSQPSPENKFGLMLLPVPLLASLGVMEWQLHTFRARMGQLSHSAESVDEFSAMAWYVFCRSFAICVAAIVTPALAVCVAVRIHGGNIPIGALAVQCTLGAVFFADLILVLLDRLELVLQSWFIGATAGGLTVLGGVVLTGSDLGATVFPAASVLVSVVLVSLLVHSHKVVSAAMSH